MGEQYPFVIERPYGRVTVVLEVFGDGDNMVAGWRWIEGHIDLPPKAALKVIREEILKIEDIARQSGVSEMRHAGEDRAVFFPDYEPFEGLRNGRRKRLING
jgi:hypothetical protein